MGFIEFVNKDEDYVLLLNRNVLKLLLYEKLLIFGCGIKQVLK